MTRPRAASGRRRGPFWMALRAAAIGYVAWCVALFFAQDSLIFQPSSARGVLPDSKIPAEIARLWIDIDGGGRVEAWLRMPLAAKAAPKDAKASAEPVKYPLLVLFHGNGDTIDGVARVGDYWRQRGWAVLTPEYRGYGRSGGKPSERAIVADAVRFVDLVKARPEIDATLVVYDGLSLGGGVAAQLARQRPPSGLILQSTFTSVASFASGFGAPGWLVRSPFRTDEALRTLKMPVLIVHGTEDPIVPVEHSRRLVKITDSSGSPRRILELRGGHVDFGDDAAFWNAVDDWLKEVRRPGSSPAGTDQGR